MKQYFDPDLFGGRARNGYGIAYSKNAIEYRWYYPGESVKEADVAEFLKKCYLNRQDEKNMAVPVDNQDLFRESGVREVQCATGYDKEADATIFRNRIVFLNDFSPQKAIESDTAKPAKAGK